MLTFICPTFRAVNPMSLVQTRQPTRAESALADPRSLAVAYYEAFDARDFEALRRLCAPDVGLVEQNNRVEGVDDVLTFVAEVHRRFPGIRTNLRMTAVLAHCVITEMRYEAPRGALWSLDGRAAGFLDIYDDRIVEVRTYYAESTADRTGRRTEPVQVPAPTFTLAREEKALREIAGLVAREASPDAVFAATNREIGLMVDAGATSFFQFFDDDTMQMKATWPEGSTAAVGDRRPMDAPMIELCRTALPVRFDVLPEGAPFLEEARAYGVRSAIAVPLVVDDRVWGVVFVTSTTGTPFPSDTEHRVLRFTALAGIAVAHARSREMLAASRARVLAAADASRRQVRRDLHDGAQQRLVQAIINLKSAQSAAAEHDCGAHGALTEALHHAELAQAELGDLVRGILPAALTREGLSTAIDSLVDDLPLHVVSDIIDGRLPAVVETAAYFVIAEALTNVLKHAQVDRADVRARLVGDVLVLEIRDAGVGGADADGGTGLRGLADRVEASGGRLSLDSPAGRGTTVRAEIPCSRPRSATRDR